MDDEQLAKFLGVAGKKGEHKIVSGISPEQRHVYQQMLDTEAALMAWMDGRGPKPPGVIVCMRRKR
jgi:hypothetical protein